MPTLIVHTDTLIPHLGRMPGNVLHQPLLRREVVDDLLSMRVQLVLQTEEKRVV